MKVKYLYNICKNPYFNLALEEYYLAHSQESMFILWQNAPTVVLGKNQNALTEVNMKALNKRNIFLARRITGGGSVYHDLGNINFTFILPEREDNLKKSINIVMEILQNFNITAEINGRNDITVNGKKISGIAQIMRKGKHMIHGTLMYDVDISVLDKVLTPSKIKLEKRGVNSVKSRVGNIKEEISGSVSTEEFLSFIDRYIKVQKGYEEIKIEKNEEDEIYKLSKKFKQKEWIYGVEEYFYHSMISKDREISIALKVKNSKLVDIKFQGDFINEMDINILEEALAGTVMEFDSLKANLIKSNYDRYLGDIDLYDLCIFIIEISAREEM